MDQKGVNTRARFLFIAMAACLAFPPLDVPFIGLSFSAPLFALAVIELVGSHLPLDMRRLESLALWAAGFWSALALSLSLNSLNGSLTIEPLADGLTLVRFAIWLCVFFVTALVTSRGDLGRTLVSVSGWSVMVLGGCRLAEAVFFGTWGEKNSRLLTPNSYGLQFSMYFACALVLLLRETVPQLRHRLVAAVGLALLSLSVVANVSRSSWIAIGVSLSSVIMILRVGGQLGTRILGFGLVAISSVVLAVVLMPTSFRDRVVAIGSKFENLEADKSYMTRKLLQEKALGLARDAPIIGVGLNRFRSSDMELEMPAVFRGRRSGSYVGRSAHNSYMPILAETGLIGAGLLALLLLYLVVAGFQAAVRSVRRQEYWTVGVYASFIGMSVHLWSMNGLTSTAPWFIYGLVAGVIKRDDSLGDYPPVARC